VKNALAAFLLALLTVAPARGADTDADKWGSLELGAGPYRPHIDSGVSGSPYRAVFGGKPAPMFRLHVGKTIFTGEWGVVEAGFKTGFFSKAGHALYASGPNAGSPSPDRTSFSVIPTSLTLTYRTDFLYERFGWPLVPYARVGLERYNWWVTKGDKWKAKGATNGYSATGGVAFIIDFLDPDAGRDLSREVGVNHTALYFDVTKSKVNDFGSKKSFDLSEDVLFWSGGLLLVF
jgi:hypothetical protein